MGPMGFSEKELVEDYLLKQLQAKGWGSVEGEKLERDSLEEPLLVRNLIRALQRVNPGFELGDQEIGRVLNELRMVGSGSEGAKRLLSFFKFGVPVKFEKDKVLRYVQLFDYDHLEQNEFIISRQVTYAGREKIRTDLILYVNGVPLVDIECKDPTAPGVSWYEAYKQIKDYEQAVPELYKYIQIGVAAETKARYFPIIPWQKSEEVSTHEWREDGKDSVDAIVEMLAPDRLLDLLKHFFFCRIERGEATKVIARYMQYRAANRIVDRVLGHVRGEEDKTRGLIWHWQGSGKTLTMIFAAHKLYYASEMENPTVFFIVDRLELEEQLYTEFNSLDILEPEVLGSVEELKDVLKVDDYRGKRGVFITLIHKFRREELHNLQRELEELSEGRKTIANRENVVAFVDEGHRTQYGTLAAQMKAIFKKAFFFALTGTPIAKRGRDTYLEFSYPPTESYLDRYFIVDSIQDGFTVKIAYQPRLDSVHLKKEMLEAFLEMEEEEIPEDLREVVKAKVRERLNVIKVFLENRARIQEIARDIARHFRENVDGRFKAMVVAASRKACVQYKQALDRLLPAEYSEVIMTAAPGEEGLLAGYVREAREKYAWKDFREIVKDKVGKFKEEEYPKLLIVTDMLLTGFDAPILQTMYLDKPLKEHRLLQAVARTNRPYQGLKEAGLILDYVGILKEFSKALAMYSREDVRHALYDSNALKQEFVGLLRDLQSLLGNPSLRYDREALLDAVEILTSDPEKEEKFVSDYRSARKLFELLGPDEVKLEQFETFKWLSAIYTYYMKLVNERPAVDTWASKFYDKTVKFVHRTTEIEKIERELPVIRFDAESLRRLEEQAQSREEKAANILFTLHRLVLVDKGKSPIYESLAERVERLFDLWREKAKDYKRIYSEGTRLFQEVIALRDRQNSLGFSDFEYGMLLALEQAFGQKASWPEEVRSLSAELKTHMFPGWDIQTTIRKEIEREVRRFVLGLKDHYCLTLEAMDGLYRKLIQQVKNYGSSGHPL